MLLYLLYKEGRTPLCITITIVLSERLVHMERQCWANVQYSWRECGTIVGILSSIYHDQLEESVCKLFDKLNCNIVKDYLGDCHRLRDDRAIVKFFKRKDCKQVLSVKNELKNISMADLGSEENGSIYINQSLCSYYKMLWSWSKKLHNMGRIYSWYVSGGTIKIKIHEHGDSISVTHTDEHFPGVDFTTFHNPK